MEAKRERSVSAAELVRNFAHWREVGSHEPVKITHHGRETHIFMALERFRTIAREKPSSRPGDASLELANRLHQGVIICGSDLRIEFANHVALTMANRWHQTLNGRDLWDGLPELRGALTEAHIRHTLASGEANAADIPSPFRDESWLRFETFPYREGIAILLRDISSEMQRLRLADVKTAMLRAMNLHGGVGYIRISARNFIEFADDSFCKMLGLPPDRLMNVCLPDLVELSARPRFREDIEHVMRGEGDRLVETRLLTNTGAIQPIKGALVRLCGTYGTEGAVMVLTPDTNQLPTGQLSGGKSDL
ncbi:PAS domain-containing protein [Sphingobium sp. OAS761]|uniref:PAS domain-containing protein n=1 Tax=Sphingobium sp. OAS761 TaxID=2817901 RepID=UPI00209FDBD9|nr:PAS domain-containing protein [Sphingobium sp. OAS761]MCP1469855.1 PAS domain-containing protein [Sphingobium sp. OAS761]